MITDLTIMLYVTDVEASATFWKALGFENVMQQDLGSGYETVLLMYSDMGAAIQLYDIEYIRATQPELADRKPVLLFSADTIDRLYQNAKSASAQVSNLQPYGDQYAFTLADPDGNVFTILGDLVDKPATEEELLEFDTDIEKLMPMSFDAVDALAKPAYIFFGSKDDAWSRRIAREFPQLRSTIYWVNTDGTDANQPMRKKYGVSTVPTLIKRASSGQYVRYEPTKESVTAFTGEK